MGVRTKTILPVLCWLICCLTTKAQLYNYVPLTFENLEVNPGIVAKRSFNDRIAFSHTHGFNTSTICDQLHYSHYFKSAFTGLGVALNRISYGKNNVIHSGGIAVGYRNMIAKDIPIRFGGFFRYVNTYSNENTFDYYEIDLHPGSPFSRNQQMVNWSVMVGDPKSSNYAFFGMQNLALPWSDRDTVHQFGLQQTWEAGNLIPALGGQAHNRLTYSGRRRVMPDREVFEHYVNLRTAFLHLSRKVSTLIGGRVGWSQDDYVHIAPAFTLFTERFAWTIAYNQHLSTGSATAPPSSIQTSLTYIFYK